MRIKAVFIILTTTFACASAQTSSTSIAAVPPLGFVLDNHALRPILGIPGASVLGSPLDLGFSINEAVVAGNGQYALAIAALGRQVRLIRLTEPVSAAPLPIVGRALGVFVSPRGTAAAITTVEGSVVFLTRLTAESPEVVQFPIASRPSALAVTDDGRFILAADSDTQNLLLVGRDGSRTSIAAPGHVSALAFRPSAYDALATGPDNTVWWIKTPLSDPSFTPIAGLDDGIQSPAAVAFSQDGRRAAVANAGNDTISIVDLQSGVKSSVSCACRPVRLEPLASPGFFRVNETSERPLYIVDTSSPRILFVPPASEIRQRPVHVRFAGQVQ